MDGLFEPVLFTASKQLDAVAELVYAIGVEEFADCDGVFGVDAALVDPFLDFVEVDGYEVGGPAVIIRLNSLTRDVQ